MASNTKVRHGLDPYIPHNTSNYYKKESIFTFYHEKRHLQITLTVAPPADVTDPSLSDWRSRERTKTMVVTIAICLNAGVDPPDVIKASPCARLECWLDPLAYPDPKKAVEAVSKRLSAQYEVWQPRAKYKIAPDPTAEDLKKLCALSRRNAKDERVLFHYTGHGVPRPTASGEIWVFNREYTQYIPVNLQDLQAWLGGPSILVLDCSAAENIVKAWNRFAEQRDRELPRSSVAANAVTATPQPPSQQTPGAIPAMLTASLRDCVHLAACGSQETLPTDPNCPADIFSCCLTTPIETALRFFVQQNPTLFSSLPLESVRKLPGKLSDRRTALGELNWIFTAVTDTIAWTVLPYRTFKRLFRQDMMMAALFRNFLLAQRVMKVYGCRPVSFPKIPDTTECGIWNAWDAAVDLCLTQLPSMLQQLAAGQEVTYQHSSFFADQLQAFKVWLDRGVAAEEEAPPQLPVVLQVLLSQVHRVRALILLSRFLDLGPWAVRQALAVGIFTYVTKLLQSPSPELPPVLVFIWGRIVAVEPECAASLLKDEGYKYFLNVLDAGTAFASSAGGEQGAAAGGGGEALPNISELRAICAFVLAIFCRGQPDAQRVCLAAGTMQACLGHLQNPDHVLRQWCCLCVAELWRGPGNAEAKWNGIRDGATDILCRVALADPVPEVRAAAICALTALVGDVERTEQGLGVEQGVVLAMLGARADGSPFVRRELVVFLSTVIARDMDVHARAALEVLDEDRRREDLRYAARKPALLNEDAEQWTFAEAAVWRTVLVLSADPYWEVGRLACQVMDTVHRRMWELPVSAGLRDYVPGEPRGREDKRPASYHARDSSPTLAMAVSPSPPPPPNSASGIPGRDEKLSGPKPSGSPAFDRRPAMLPGGRLTSVLRRSASGAVMSWRNFNIFGGGAAANGGANPAGVMTISPVSGSSAGGVGDGGYYPHHPDHIPPHGLPRMSSAERGISRGRRGGVQRRQSMTGSLVNRNRVLQEDEQQQQRRSGMARVSSNRSLRLEDLSDEMGRGRTGKTLLNGVKEGKEAGADAEDGEEVVVVLPLKSRLLDWCAEYFTVPQMREPEVDEPGSEKYIERVWYAQRNEKVMQLAARGHAAAGQARWDVLRPHLLNEDMEPMLIRFEKYDERLVVSDRSHRISVWDYSTQMEETYRPKYPEQRNAFLNLNPAGTKTTVLRFINEDDETLLLAGSSDGVVRIYRDYAHPSRTQLVTSWRALTNLLDCSHGGSGMVAEWIQSRGILACSGDVRYIRVWDAAREMCMAELPTESDSPVTAITGDQLAGDMLVASFGDGSLKVFDRRLSPRQSLVRTWEEHWQWVLDIHLQRGGTRELVSGCMGGEVKLWDMRSPLSLRTILAERDGNAQAFAVHDFSPVFATAGSAHVLNMWNFSGEHLGATQAYAGMLGQRLSPVASLAFHPHQSLLAHGGADRYVLLVESSARQKGADGFGGLSGYGGATADVVREDWAGDESVVTGYNPLKVPDL